jgi:hypothetical protein
MSMNGKALSKEELDQKLGFLEGFFERAVAANPLATRVLEEIQKSGYEVSLKASPPDEPEPKFKITASDRRDMKGVIRFDD